MTKMKSASNVGDCNSKKCPSLRTLTDRQHRAHLVSLHGLGFSLGLKLNVGYYYGEGYVLGDGDAPQWMRNGHLWAVVAAVPA